MRSPTLFLAALAFLVPFLPAMRGEEIPVAAPPSKWEKEIAAFEEKDKANPPAKGGIVFVGSSSIKKWTTLTEDFPEQRPLNRGFGGSMMSDSAYFADRIVIPYAPRLVVVYAGGNDINARRTPEQVFEAFKEFTEKVRAKLPETTIDYISIAGNPKRWSQVEQVKKANSLIADYIKGQSKMNFIDVYPKMLGADGLPRPEIFSADNLHMNPTGYQLWKEIVGPYLR